MLKVRLIQFFMFPAEADETVGQLKERLQKHIEELLRKQHGETPPPVRTIPGVLGSVCCPGARAKDGLDLHLSYEGEPLTDDGKTLAQVGLKEDSELVVLSRVLAERHGASQGVTCLNEAFSGLAKSGEAGVRAEELALINSKPFPLNCSIRALGELGAGWPLFFEFVAFLALIAVALLVFHLPALFLYGFSGKDGLEKWPAADGNRTMVEFGYLTVGNLGPSGSQSVIPAFCALLSALAILVAAVAMMARQRRVKVEVDSAEVDPNDYAIFIEGLPEDATDEAEIRAFVEAHARETEGEEITDVVAVVVGYDAAVFKTLLESVAKAKVAAAAAESAEEREGLEREVAELRRPLETADGLRAHLPGSGCAVAVLRSEPEQRQCVAEWDTWREALIWQLPPSLHERLSSRPLFRGERLPRITRAANPTDLIWENLSFSSWERFKARVRTYFSLAVIFVACVGVVVGLERLNQKYELGAWFRLIIVLPLVISAKILGPVAVRRYVAQQRHATKTQKDLSLTWKYTLFAVLIYCVVPLLIAGDPGGDRGQPGYYLKGSGLFSTVLILLVVNSFVFPLLTVCGSGNLIRRAIVSCAIPGCPQSGIDLDDPPPGLTQEKYRRKFEPPDVNFPRVMAQVLKTFYLGVFFLPLFPLGLLLTSSGLLVAYWSYKYQLLRLSKRPYRQSHEVACGSIRLVLLAGAVLSITQYYLLKPSLLEGSIGRDFAHWGLYLGPLIAIAMAALPLQVGQLLGCSRICASEASLGDVDYYSAQRAWPKHCKYHATSPVYQWIEKVSWTAVRQKKPGATAPPWDPRTGNFPDPAAPAAARPDEVVPEVAPGPGSLDPGRSSSEHAVGSAAAVAEGAAPDEALPEVRDEEERAEEEAEGPEDTKAIAEVDPAVLALEEAKYRVPLSMLGEPETSDEGETLTSASSGESDVETSEDPEVPVIGATTGVEDLREGCQAEIFGLLSSAAAKYNGTTCTLRMLDLESGKWVVQLEDGEKARLPLSCLRATAVLRPGAKARIRGMVKAAQYNGTVCTLDTWSTELVKWNVRLFTGAKATVAAANLEPLVDG